MLEYFSNYYGGDRAFSACIWALTRCVLISCMSATWWGSKVTGKCPIKGHHWLGFIVPVNHTIKYGSKYENKIDIKT